MNTMAIADRNQFVQQTSGLELLGEIITWDLNPNTSITYPDLVAALETAQLESKVARVLLPRYAFARAAKKMQEQRIIMFLGESQNKLAFQFTKYYKDTAGEQFDYNIEAKLYLEKDTGSIEVTSHTLTNQQCEDMAHHAKGLLNAAIEQRTTADITRVIKRLFERQADLFPVRDAGSVYFVPERHSAFVDRVQSFVVGLSGRLNRFPVPAGTQHGNKSVQDAVSEGIEQMIQEHALAVKEFGTDTRISTVRKAIDKIEKTSFKISAYKDYLAEQRDRLDETLALVKVETEKKLEEILTAKATLKED